VQHGESRVAVPALLVYGESCEVDFVTFVGVVLADNAAGRL
jgi:hypothetical protein